MSLRLSVPSPLTGRHVLIAILGFFLTIFIVNGIFVYVSLNSHPGVTSEDAYRKGLDFNSRLEMADRQAARGWQPRIEMASDSVALSLLDAYGNPVQGRRAELEIRSPVHDRADRTVALTEITAGQYRSGALSLPAGRWQLIFTVRSPGEEPWRLEHTARIGS